MRKFLNKLLILFFVFALVVPFGVFAEGEEENNEEEQTEEKAPVRVYEFYGSTCGFCASLNSWFESIEGEYGDYFDLIKLEVWENSNNAALMETTISKLSANVSGVPFVVIGEHYTVGFDENTTPTEILGYIMEEYNKPVEERIDHVNVDGDAPVVIPEEKETNGVVVGVVFAVLVAGVVVLVIKARKED